MESNELRSLRQRQRGVTLLIALIMLIMITLMVVTSFNLGSGNLKIVANAQDRQRVTTISEQLLNGKLHDINSELSSDPCKMEALLEADGTTTRTVDNVAVTFSRTLTRAECVTKSAVVTPHDLASRALEQAEAEVVSACVDISSVQCNTATTARDAKKAEVDRALNRMMECTQTDPSGNVAITDPTLGGGGVTGGTYCVDVIMELTASGVDVLSGARSTVTRGFALHCSNHDVPEC